MPKAAEAFSTAGPTTGSARFRAALRRRAVHPQWSERSPVTCSISSAWALLERLSPLWPTGSISNESPTCEVIMSADQLDRLARTCDGKAGPAWTRTLCDGSKGARQHICRAWEELVKVVDLHRHNTPRRDQRRHLGRCRPPRPLRAHPPGVVPRDRSPPAPH